MKKLFWIDLEMTGLDETVDSILEVAVILTDMNFNILEEYHRIVYQPQEVLDKMNKWCQEQHGKSGLTKAVKDGMPLETVEKELVALVEKNFAKNKRIVLCGNSVGNDQRFLLKYMPKFSKRLHYRVIDVSSFKEVFRQKYKIKVKKEDPHRAIGDIKESIEELKTYLSYVIVPDKKSKKS